MRNKRLLKNTLALYVRQVLILLVNLYTLRVVLNALGIEDYGIYSVVAGVVTLCSFFPATMASATQRFFSYALGANDPEKLRKTFSVNWLLYVFVAIMALLILESIGFWFVNSHLSIPKERFDAAQMLYHLATLSFIVSIFSSPFMAIIIAHEDMHIYAYISILEAILKLSIVFLLGYGPWDKLEVYGYLLLIVAVISASAYLAVCKIKYAECQFKKLHWDTVIVKEIVNFTGWTLFGQFTTVARYQAVTILINQTFDPVTVAARTVALTVANQAAVFANNFNTGLYPPIIKSYASNEKDEMFSLVFNGSKLTFFLMWVFALPIIIEMDEILNLWLKTPPLDASLFTRLALVESLIMSISLPIATAARAPGHMRLYELVLGSIQIMIFLVSWLVLSNGFKAYSVFVVAIVANIAMFVARIIIVRELTDLPMGQFYRKVVLPILLVVSLSSVPTIAVRSVLPSGVLSSAFVVCLAIVLSTICMYYIGLDDRWRMMIRQKCAAKLFRRDI